MNYVYEYPRPALGCECVVFDTNEDVPQVLLVRRGNEPYKGMWSIPAGFMDIDEDLDECPVRELYEETGVDILRGDVTQIYTKGKINDDPRGRIIVVVYATTVDKNEHVLCAGDDAEDAAWFRMDELPELAADHLETVRKTLGEMYHDRS